MAGSNGRTRSGRHRRAVVLAGSAATALAVFGLGEPAGAATTTSTDTFEFQPNGGTPASCTISLQADFPFGGANGGRAITTVSGSNPACTTGVTTVVGAQYRHTNGEFVTTPNTFTHGTSETQTYTNVARDFGTFHQVYFPACGCATQVYTLSVANPK